MNRWFRWYGALSFVGILVALGLLVWSLSSWLIATVAEQGLSSANGAEVNIERVDWQMSPFQVELFGVQATNPITPTRNRVQVEQVAIQASLRELMLGRVHSRNIQVSGIAFDTQRESTGWVDKNPENEQRAEDLQGRLEQWNISLPSSDEVIDRLALQTQEQVDTFNENLEATKEQVREAREALPSAEDIEAFQECFEAIVNSDPSGPVELLEAKEALSELKDDVREAKAAVEHFVAVTNASMEATQSELNELQQSTQTDLSRLGNVLSLNPDSLPQWSGILFGPTVEAWVARGNSLLQWVAPKLKKAKDEQQKPSRWEGRYVDLNSSRPRLWLENIDVSFAAWQGALALSIQDVTYQHALIGNPTRFNLTSQATEKWDALEFSGDLSFASGLMVGNQVWNVQGFKLANMQLLENQDLSAELLQAGLNSSGETSLNGTALSGGGAFSLSQVNMAFSGEGSMAPRLDSLFSSMSSFSMDLSLSGEVSAPSLSLNTDLDNQLASAFANQIRSELQSQISSGEERLNQIIGQADEDGASWLGRTQEQLAEGSSLEDSLTEMLETELDDLIESERERALERLRERIGKD